MAVLSAWRSFWRQFWQIWLASLSSASSYRDWTRLSWRQTVTFVVVSYVLLGAVAGLRLAAVTIPGWTKFAVAAGDVFVEVFPDDTTLNWDGQQLQTTPATSINIPFPPEAAVPSLDQASQEFEWLVVFDTDADPDNQQQGQGSPGDGEDDGDAEGDDGTQDGTESADASALLLVTANQVTVRDQLDNRRGLDLSTLIDAQPWTIDSSSAEPVVDAWQSQVRELVPLLRAVGVIVLPLVLLPFRLVTSLLDLILAYLLLALFGLKLKRRPTIQLILHIMVVAELVAQLGHWTFANQLASAGLPLFAIAFWLILSYVALWWRSNLADGKS